MTADNSIIITRTVPASRERVWQALTDPEQLKQWWGPDGFTITTSTFEMKEGGHWDFMMHGPDGRDYQNHVVFTQIEEPRILAHKHGGDEGIEFNATITLEERDGKTLVTMTSVFPTAEMKEYVIREHHAVEGGNQTLGRLEQFMSGR